MKITLFLLVTLAAVGCASPSRQVTSEGSHPRGLSPHNEAFFYTAGVRH